MSEQAIYWTVLPNGRNMQTNRPRLSLFVTPKLTPSTQNTGEPTLSQFRDFLDWPSKVNARLPLSAQNQGQPAKHASLLIRGGGNPTFELRRVSNDYENDSYASTMWTSLFNERTTVKAPSSPAARTIRSYPVAPASNHLKRHYLKMLELTAQSGLPLATTELSCPRAPLPQVEDLRKLDTLAEVAIYQPAHAFYPVVAQPTPTPITGRVRGTDDVERRITRSLRRLAQHPTVRLTQDAIDEVVRVETRIASQPNTPDLALTDQTNDDSALSSYVQMLLTHRRRTRARTGTPVPAPILPPCEFHSYLSLLGAYPWLLRRLCLVLDFEVLGDIASFPRAGCVKIVLPEPNSSDSTPWTAFTWDAGSNTFEPTPADPNYIRERMLNLADGNLYSVERLDVEGGAIKTIHFQDALDRASTHNTADTPPQMAPPSLRSAGFSVVQKARGARLARQVNAFACACHDVPADEMVFCAEHLARGLRIDVWDKVSGKWHSLCERRGSYVFEHWNSGTNAKKTFTPAREPEGFITATLTKPTGEPSTDSQSPEDDHLHEALFRWEGWSLSAPRPGKGLATSSSSALKQQQCDLGINIKFRATPGSLPALRLRGDYQYKFRARVVDLAGNSLDLNEVTDDKSYAIPPGDPISYRRFEPIPAPTVILTERLNPNDSRSEMVNRLVVRAGVQDTLRCQRLIVPPKGTGLLAEISGNLDQSASGTARPRPDAYSLLTQYDSNFDVDENPDDPTDPNYSRNPIYTPYQYRHGKTPDRTFQLPYLADPSSYGATVSFHDSFDNEIPYKDLFDNLKPVNGGNPFSFFYDENQWPDVRPFLIRLVGESDRPRCAWDFTLDGRVLTVALPPAQILKLRLSSNPSADRQGTRSEQQSTTTHGLVEWLEETRDLRDKSVPHFTNDEYDYLTSAIHSGKHTFVTPDVELTLVHAVDKPLITPAFTAKFWVARSIGSPLADLKDDFIVVDGRSTVKLDVLAHWTEPVDDTTKPDWGTVDRDVHVCEIPVCYGDVGVPLQYSQDLSPSGTKYRRIHYRLSASSRFREYFKMSADPKSFTVEGPEVVIEVLNTARPDLVKAPYIIPTFEWHKEVKSDGSATTSVRRGGGLRVYFEREWFSTGEGELLGVVLCPSQILEDCTNAQAARAQSKSRNAKDLPDPDEAKKPYVTQWGSDPIWSTASLPDLPGQEHFRNVREFRRGLSLAELPDSPNDPNVVQHRFSVAAFDVHYDKTQRLWFSDIEMETGRSYYPFVRLALVRYQPHSVFDLSGQSCHLSQVVLADFAQLAPDRWATVSRTAEDSSVFHMTVYGVTPSSPTQSGGHQNGASTPTVVTVSLEHAMPLFHDRDEDLSWVACGTGSLANVQPCSDGDPNEIPLPLKSFHDGVSLWSSEFRLPSDWKRNKYRVVIREYELLSADGDDRRNIDRTSIKKRMVYADVLQI
jgi:hypothetical protein